MNYKCCFRLLWALLVCFQFCVVGPHSRAGYALKRRNRGNRQQRKQQQETPKGTLQDGEPAYGRGPATQERGTRTRHQTAGDDKKEPARTGAAETNGWVSPPERLPFGVSCYCLHCYTHSHHCISLYRNYQCAKVSWHKQRKQMSEVPCPRAKPIYQSNSYPIPRPTPLQRHACDVQVQHHVDAKRGTVCLVATRRAAFISVERSHALSCVASSSFACAHADPNSAACTP